MSAGQVQIIVITHPVPVGGHQGLAIFHQIIIGAGDSLGRSYKSAVAILRLHYTNDPVGENAVQLVAARGSEGHSEGCRAIYICCDINVEVADAKSFDLDKQRRYIFSSAASDREAWIRYEVEREFTVFYA